MVTLATFVLGDVFDTINSYPPVTDPVVHGKQFNDTSDPSISGLLEGNNRWASTIKANDPGYFEKLSQSQDPKILWIGCSDSREAVDTITGTSPGTIFIHRNIGNIFYEDDMNILSVLEYAINNLNISHIIVAGHTHCGAVKASLERKPLGLIDNWLRRPQNVYTEFRSSLDPLEENFKEGVISVLNAQMSVRNIVRTSILQKAWARGLKISVHAWLFDLDTGLLHDTKFSVNGPQDLDPSARWQV